MIEGIIGLVIGIVIGISIIYFTPKIIEWKQERDWRKAGEQWSRTFQRAEKAGEFFGDLPPDDDLVEDIRNRTIESNILSECEQEEHQKRIEEKEKEIKEFEEMYGKK